MFLLSLSEDHSLRNNGSLDAGLNYILKKECKSNISFIFPVIKVTFPNQAFLKSLKELQLGSQEKDKKNQSIK